MGVHGQSVNEGNYDILDVDCLLELSTGLEERIESLKVKLIRKNLQRERVGWRERQREEEREREGGREGVRERAGE